MRLKVSTFSAYWEGTSELLPYNKGGLDHVEVGLGQREDLTLCLLLSACF